MSANMVKRKRDRLSNLPDPIIHHILSLMNTKKAVQTCVLSKKWRLHWTHIHSLNLNFESFNKRVAFGKFVLHILRHREPSNIQRLSFNCGYSRKPAPYIKKIFQYAISHNVEEFETDLDDFPSCFYGCQTLKSLKLLKCYYISTINSFGFASLSTLELTQIRLSHENNNHDVFSNYLNLKNLILKGCSISATGDFTIVASTVVNLTIWYLCHSNSNPKDRKIVISAPRLEFFDLKVTNTIELRLYQCPVLRKVNLHINTTVAWREIIDWRQEYFWDLICMAGGYYAKPAILLSFKFSKGKFRSYHIPTHTESEVTVIDEVERKRLWFYDGEMVWQSTPS